MLRDTAPAAFFPSGVPLSKPVHALSRLRQVADAVLHWICGGEAVHDDEPAGRMISRWGDLALDVALARSSAETGGFFDAVDTGFWADTAREIRQRQS